MADGYVTEDALRATLSLSGTNFADEDIAVALPAAKEAIDQICDRAFDEFDISNGEPTQRLYTPQRGSTVEIDDCIQVTQVAIDYSGRGDFDSNVWDEGTDYLVDPLNATVKGKPIERVRIRGGLARRGTGFPVGVPGSVRVTAKYGWPVTPERVINANSILATRLLKRMREAPFGVVTVGLDVGAAMRIARSDPDVMMLLDGLSRAPVVG